MILTFLNEKTTHLTPSDVPRIPVVTHAAASEALLLEDQLAVELMTVAIRALAKIEIFCMRVTALITVIIIDEIIEEHIEGTRGFTFGRCRNILCVYDLWGFKNQGATDRLSIAVGSHEKTDIVGEPRLQ